MDERGDFGPSQVHRSAAAGVEQSVHRWKRLPRGHGCAGELPPGRQAAMEAKGNKQRLVDTMQVRQAAVEKVHREYKVLVRSRESQREAGLETRRRRGRLPTTHRK